MFKRLLRSIVDILTAPFDRLLLKFAIRCGYFQIPIRDGQGRDLFSETEIAEYWIGKGVDYRGLWDAYEDGRGYIEKFFSRETYLLRIKFQIPSTNAPLFNHEAVHKTLKGCFHDMKVLCFTRDVYNDALPLFPIPSLAAPVFGNFLAVSGSCSYLEPRSQTNC